MLRRVAPFIIAVVAGAAPLHAQDMESFRSPSGNIACAYFKAYLRCDLAQVSNPLPARPADCELEWGLAFEMAADDGEAARICHGDTVLDPQAPVLEYGESWKADGFSCDSSERGIRCRNELGAGWDLSRARQVLY